MQTVLEDLGENIDIVLLDAPPISSVSDAAVLAQRADGVVLVCRAGVSKRDEVRDARQLLEHVRARIVGVVLTEAEG
jgi:non-specific protein-tyrosine kinase